MIAATSLGTARIVLVEAPVGFGKTTFAERLLAADTRVPVRVRTNGDLVASLKRALGRAGVTHAQDAGDFDGIVASLVSGMVTMDLFVDDAHTLTPEAADALADFVGDVPSTSRAIVCGRDLTSFRELATRPTTRSVGIDDLRLDADDIAALLGVASTEVVVRELLAATEGWPAAVALAVDRVRRDPQWSAVGASGARALLRTLVDELVSSDPRIADIAQLPLYDDTVVALVGGSARPLDIPARRLGRWQVVPAVIRDLVEYDPLPRSVILDVAAHYHRNGETATAVTLLRDAGADDAVLTFLTELHWTELEALSATELQVVLDEIDGAGTDRHARLLVNAARAVELSDRSLRSVWLERAAESTDPTTARAAQAELARDQLRSADVDGGAALAEQVLAQAPDSEPVTRARALVTLGMRDAFTSTPHSLADAAERFAQAAHLYRAAGETALRAETLARLGYTALYMAGRPADGQAAMAEALALLPVGDRVRAYWLTCYTDVLDFLGRDDEADAAVREALEIGTQHRDPTTAGMAWWSRSWLAAHRGNRTELHEALAQVEAHRGGWLQGGQEAEFLASSAENLSLVGDVVGYHDYLARAEQIAGAIDYAEVVTIARSCFEAEHGDAGVGLELLDALDTSRAVIPSGAPLRALLRAVAHARRGEREPARSAYDTAAALARAMGVPDLLARQQRQQLRALEALLDDPPALVAPVARLHLLGRFSLTVGDDNHTPQIGHPATLVKLLALRGSLTVDAAVDALWPDTDISTGRARLRNVLNRLKERSGAVVVRDGDVLRLDPGLVVDAAAFEAAAAVALSAAQPERVGRARLALALYTGELLPGDQYEEWAAVDRARLQRRFVSLADLVAADCIERGDLDEAARLLDLGILAEPLDEDRPLRLCSLLVEQGRVSASRQVARRCVAVLADLDVEPSPDLLRFAGSSDARRTP